MYINVSKFGSFENLSFTTESFFYDKLNIIKKHDCKIFFLNKS